MHALIAVTLLVAFQQEPKISFANCNEHKAHIAVQSVRDGHLVHFHVLVENAAGKTAFARLRCAEKDEADQSELQLKRFRISGNKEEWSVYFHVPRQPAQMVHQVEIGFRGQSDPLVVDEFRVLDSFAWVFKNGEIHTSTKEEPVGLETIVRRAVIKGGEFTIVSTAVYRGASDIICKKTNAIRGEIDGSRALKRIFPK